MTQWSCYFKHRTWKVKILSKFNLVFNTTHTSRKPFQSYSSVPERNNDNYFYIFNINIPYNLDVFANK